jgi:hypothetical protein
MQNLVNEANTLKSNLEEWKKSLPSYYEPMTLPTEYVELDESVDLIGYPYESRLDYVASNFLLIM